MFVGLAISGVTAYIVSLWPGAYHFIFDNVFIFFGLIGTELALVFSLIFFVKKVPGRFALLLFLLYCFVTGLTLSIIFLVYTIQSIALTLFISAGMFGLMSIYGYVTKADLTKLGQVMIMGLIGVVFASVANLFLQSSRLDWIISVVGVIVFTGLTAYDTQKIKKTNILGNEGTEEDFKESIMGSLTLYLDFINLFLKLLRLFGGRK